MQRNPSAKSLDIQKGIDNRSRKIMKETRNEDDSK